MYRTIIIDCQNKSEEISCEDCALYQDCSLRREKQAKARSK
ncbi:MAG: hypothetical protein ACQCN3_12165 [Candidatus Bathyarchaeia archaeon]